MYVLIACEESQRVCLAFRKRGHIAFSCDLQDCSGGHPEWHIKADCIPLLNGFCTFTTCNGKKYRLNSKWDLIIAFPPCTYLTNSGNRWFDVIRYGYNAQNRWNDRCRSIVFFLRIAFAECDKIVIENPIGCMSTYFRKPDQIIHPYFFAESEDDVNCERKSTCLWLKGVQPLKYKIKYQPRIISYKNGQGTDSLWHIDTLSLPECERAKVRSKTFPGIAEAMALQWGVYD